MDNKIILITPPDKLFNQNSSCLLIYPSDSVRKETQDILARSENGQNIYIYNVDEENIDVDWLLSVAKMSDVVIFDIDNSDEHVRALASYIVSLPHTYWLTAEDKWLYNKISANRIYGLDAIEHLIGG
jgi:hypothetical protein